MDSGGELEHNPVMERLARDQIETALAALDRELSRRGVKAQLYLVGGAVMCLVHEARTSTRDVDAWFTEPQVVRSAAREVAEELSLPEDWLNDAAKAFIPTGAGFDSWRALSHLEVLAADAKTLLAMKCAAARTAEDAADIRFLADHLGLHSSAQILDVVLAYYPPDRLPVRTRLLLEEMFDDGG
jgi:hypothetical protein